MILWVVSVFCFKKNANNNNKSGCVFVLLLLYCLYSSCFLPCHGVDPPSPDPDGPTTRTTTTTSKVIILSILFGCITGLGCALACACLLRCIFTYIKRVPILKGPVVFSPNISPKSLQSALVSSNQTLTLLPNGNYYKTLLDNGLTFAIKKLEHPPFQNEPKNKKRRIQKELEILASLNHRHLMSLRAYVVSDNRFCLAYDYVPTGSLEDAIRKRRDNELQFGWDARLRIAVGIIKGLQYLHFTCTPSICHYNLKPSNVMLDADFEPRLTDCGLAKVMHNFNSSSSPSYFAPECFPNFSIYTEKSDIFSFGVTLGILLTGRDPSDPLFGEATSGSRGDMGMWFRHLVETGDAREALDKSLLGQEMEEDEMLMAVRIAAVCLSDIPADRPSSDELVPMLTQLHSF